MVFKGLEKWADENHIKLNKANVKSYSWRGLSPCNSTSKVPRQHCVQFWSFSLQERQDVLEQVIWRTTKTTKELEHVAYVERLK